MRYALSAALLAASLVSALPASAHALLKTALPAVGAIVQTAPTEINIGYTESVEPRFSHIQVFDKQHHDEAAGPLTSGGDPTHLVLPLKTLTPGLYEVDWHATSTDTHKTSGRFTFTVQR